MPRFSIRGTTGVAVYHSIDKDVITAGGSPDNDLVVPGPLVSPHHAEIRRDGGDWLIADLASRHGTLLNGQRVREPAGLKAGDRIELGAAVIVIDGPGTDPAPRTRSVAERPAAVPERRVPPAAEPVLVGTSPPMLALQEMINRVAPSTATVLIRGESGTGKEIVAKLVHHRSPRASHPLVVVNCPALPGSLIEYELFGVGKGVATGVDARPGLLELANGGTLLLDEVGDLELVAQAKLLRFIQDKKVERIGGRKLLSLDVRILAATNHDLAAFVDSGKFRVDLYHRLNTVTLHTPPLRERPEDIPALVDHFLSLGEGRPLRMSPEALDRLRTYSFPGNVRELERIIERARLLTDGPLIDIRALPALETAHAVPPAGAAPSREVATAAELYARVVRGGESFWDVVHAPFLRRSLPAEAVRHLIERCYREAAGSNRQMARLFRLQDVKQYKRLTAFLRNHGLIVPKASADDRS